jgi:hypothetical protein
MRARVSANLPERSRELAGDSPRSKDFVFVEGFFVEVRFWSIFVEVRSLGVGFQ